MEETLAGLIAAIERVVRPMGFRIEEAYRRENTSLIMAGAEGQDSDDSELRITIVRKGKTG